MCTSTDEVRAYLEDAAYRLFCAAPDLAGFFTISMSENITELLFSRAGCGRLPALLCPPALGRGGRGERSAGARRDRANPAARAIAWSWAWGDWGREIVRAAHGGADRAVHSEEALTTFVGGVEGSVLDYTLSQTGPGETAKALWRAARARGLETCAKVQINNTWELAAVPWLPVFDKVEALLANLEKRACATLQLSWTLGRLSFAYLAFRLYGRAGRARVFAGLAGADSRRDGLCGAKAHERSLWRISFPHFRGLSCAAEFRPHGAVLCGRDRLECHDGGLSIR